MRRWELGDVKLLCCWKEGQTFNAKNWTWWWNILGVKCIAMKFGINIDKFYVCPTNAHAKNETFDFWIKYHIIVV